jgi:hypothetical protein
MNVFDLCPYCQCGNKCLALDRCELVAQGVYRADPIPLTFINEGQGKRVAVSIGGLRDGKFSAPAQIGDSVTYMEGGNQYIVHNAVVNIGDEFIAAVINGRVISITKVK